MIVLELFAKAGMSNGQSRKMVDGKKSFLLYCIPANLLSLYL
jgi:hypothetical protein